LPKKKNLEGEVDVKIIDKQCKKNTEKYSSDQGIYQSFEELHLMENYLMTLRRRLHLALGMKLTNFFSRSLKLVFK
jgi:hypothetical protein